MTFRKVDLKKWWQRYTLLLFFHFCTCKLHHGEHTCDCVCMCVSIFMYKCLCLSVFMYECVCVWVYINPNSVFVRWCSNSGLGSVKLFFFILPKAFLLDNGCACVCVCVYHLEVELIRALGISLSSHSFPTRTILPKMDFEHWGLDLLTSHKYMFW